MLTNDLLDVLVKYSSDRRAASSYLWGSLEKINIRMVHKFIMYSLEGNFRDLYKVLRTQKKIRKRYFKSLVFIPWYYESRIFYKKKKLKFRKLTNKTNNRKK